MADERYGSRPTVVINGTELAEALTRSLVSVVVETDLRAPGSCTVEFADPERAILSQLSVEYLQTLEVLGAPAAERDQEQLFLGSIYTMEFEADERGCHSLIRAYDDGYKLRQRRGIKTWNDMTDNDIINDVVQAAGISTGTVDAGTTSHSYVAQMNETDWEFIQRRARLSDSIVFVRAGKLNVMPQPEASDGPPPGDHGSRDPLQLTPGHNLHYLRAAATATHQVGEIEVRGWDPARAEAVSVTATPKDRGTEVDDRPSKVGADFGAAKRLATASTMQTDAEAQKLADSLGEMVASAFTYVEGSLDGDPRLQAGVAVSLGGTGSFDGRYTISTARHSFGPDGYHTEITISGEHDRSIYGIGRSCSAMPTVPGAQPALVTNVSDPEKLGRVKLTYPWLSDDFESDWARVSQIGAGPDRGLMWFPEVNDEVLVTFMDGKPSRPVVLGSLYNGQHTPPYEGFADPDDGEIDTRCLKTRTGHVLLFQDKSGEELVQIQTGDQSIDVLLDQANAKFVVTSTGDVDVNADGKVNVKAGGDLTLDAGGNCTIKAGASMSIEASGTLDIAGAMIQLN